ncbi:MAG: TIGR03668 family PPOX class F420-dependent oxidoreductase [Chloroflexi bacterium]|nr:MAG: TIGR03668 family PPOX class F420-dependent oxidoreductase [Chloroflexota bacterium]
MDPELMRRRVAEARVGRLATVTPEARPHLVPVCFVLAEDDLYWAVDQKPKASRDLARLRNLAVNALAELLVDSYEEDWTRLWWVRAACTTTVLESGPEAERALDLLAAKYPQYRARRPAGPVVRMRVLRWSGWSGEGIDL